jgi:hypothetical protein
MARHPLLIIYLNNKQKIAFLCLRLMDVDGWLWLIPQAGMNGFFRKGQLWQN